MQSSGRACVFFGMISYGVVVGHACCDDCECVGRGARIHAHRLVEKRVSYLSPVFDRRGMEWF